MKVYLKPVNIDTKVSTSTIQKYSDDEKHLMITIFPIPEWLHDAKCKCGQPAKFLSGDQPICQNDLINCLKYKNVLMKEEDLSVPLAITAIHKMGFEWSTTGDKWYHVRGRNIKIDGNEQEFLESLKPALLNGENASFEGEYDKENKTLTITL